MKKQAVISITEKQHAFLHKLADAKYEGNLSLTIRNIINYYQEKEA